MNTSVSTNKPKLTQAKVNKAWDDVIDQWNTPWEHMYLTKANHPEFWLMSREYQERDSIGIPVEFINSLSKKEALMFYAFVILAEDWEIPS